MREETTEDEKKTFIYPWGLSLIQQDIILLLRGDELFRLNRVCPNWVPDTGSMPGKLAICPVKNVFGPTVKSITRHARPLANGLSGIHFYKKMDSRQKRAGMTGIGIGIEAIRYIIY